MSLLYIIMRLVVNMGLRQKWVAFHFLSLKECSALLVADYMPLSKGLSWFRSFLLQMAVFSLSLKRF